MFDESRWPRLFSLDQYYVSPSKRKMKLALELVTKVPSYDGENSRTIAILGRSALKAEETKSAPEPIKPSGEVV